jgi:hypothetical protein
MERDQLAQLLDESDYASTACRHALLEGAAFIVWDGCTPADRMVPAYERREARAVAEGVATLGFSGALAALRGVGSQLVRLAQVTIAHPPYVFMIFLAGSPSAVVACLGIDQNVGAR